MLVRSACPSEFVIESSHSSCLRPDSVITVRNVERPASIHPSLHLLHVRVWHGKAEPLQDPELEDVEVLDHAEPAPVLHRELYQPYPPEEEEELVGRDRCVPVPPDAAYPAPPRHDLHQRVDHEREDAHEDERPYPVVVVKEDGPDGDLVLEVPYPRLHEVPRPVALDDPLRGPVAERRGEDVLPVQPRFPPELLFVPAVGEGTVPGLAAPLRPDQVCVARPLLNDRLDLLPDELGLHPLPAVQLRPYL